MSFLIRKHTLEYKWYRPQTGKPKLWLHAKVQEYLHYHHTNTRKSAMLLYTLVFSKLYSVDNNSDIHSATLQREVEAVLTFIDQNYFKDSAFMLGDSLTIADLSAFF
jgi:glutathione S-transferase